MKKSLKLLQGLTNHFHNNWSLLDSKDEDKNFEYNPGELLPPDFFTIVHSISNATDPVSTNP